MTIENKNLGSVSEIVSVISKSENGSQALTMASKLGLWSIESHRGHLPRASYPSEISSMTHSQISDLYSRWTSEFGRITELHGAISGQETILKIKIKSAQAKARSRIRSNQPPDAKPHSAAVLSDLADEEPEVIELIEQSSLLVLLAAHVGASKEATAQYLASISREISFRDVQMKAKLY